MTSPDPSPAAGTGGAMSLTGRICLVTGAGQGVGRAIAMRCAERGAGAVVVNDFYAERAEAVAKEIEGLGGAATAAVADVTDPESVASVVAAAEGWFGRVDVLVNNAGNMGPQPLQMAGTPFWETGPEDWKPWIDTNLFGVLNCCRSVLPGMVERRAGRIVTIISEAGRSGEARMVPYSGAKAGAAGAMRAIAREVARYGITANCVSIAATLTPAAAQTITPELKARITKAYPLGRLGQPEEVAALVAFLASDEANWITGQTYGVNGGFSFGL